MIKLTKGESVKLVPEKLVDDCLAVGWELAKEPKSKGKGKKDDDSAPDNN